jgi:DNA-directed RNA polymerase specialized sigma24 family protein
VARFRLSADDRDDAVAVAMERAWRAHAAAGQPILHPEAWARTIAARVCLDVVRRQQRERRWQERAHEDDNMAVEQQASSRPDPFELAAAAERRELLHRRLAAWPPQEQELAQVILDGEAETLTAAAWRVRQREEARGGGGTMYPHKARVLLEARRRELADLA